MLWKAQSVRSFGLTRDGMAFVAGLATLRNEKKKHTAPAILAGHIAERRGSDPVVADSADWRIRIRIRHHAS
jgi:hypothetical protein